MGDDFRPKGMFQPKRLCRFPARASTRVLVVVFASHTGHALEWGGGIFGQAAAVGASEDVAGELSKGLHKHLDSLFALVDAEATLRETEWFSFAEDVDRVLSRFEPGEISDADADDATEEDTSAIAADGWQDVSSSLQHRDAGMEDAGDSVFIWESPPTKPPKRTTHADSPFMVAAKKDKEAETDSWTVRTFEPSSAGCIDEHCVDKFSEPIFDVLEQVVDACSKDEQCVYVDYNSYLHYGHLCSSAKLTRTKCIERPIWSVHPQVLIWQHLGPSEGYVAQNEGRTHGMPLKKLTLNQCASRCEATPDCGSLSYCSDESMCYLKDKKIYVDEPMTFSGECSTYFQTKKKKVATAPATEEGGNGNSDTDAANRFAALLLSGKGKASEEAKAFEVPERVDEGAASPLNHGGEVSRQFVDKLPNEQLLQSSGQTLEQPFADAVKEDLAAQVSGSVYGKAAIEEAVRLGDESEVSSGDALGEVFGKASNSALDVAPRDVPDKGLDNILNDAVGVSLGGGRSDSPVEESEPSIADLALMRLQRKQIR